MNITLRCSACCIFLISTAHAIENECSLAPVQVKVLIDSKPRAQNSTFTFSGKNGLLVAVSDNPTQKYFFKQRMPVAIKKNALFINHKKNESTIIRITPVDGTISFAGQRYAGTIYLFCNTDDIAIVNKLPLEHYLESVLYTEGWPGWPLETYKVLAITCRTYVIWQLRHARKKNKQYHIKATNHHQTYTGIHHTETISQAVQETEGIFIAHNKQPILAMYDACCGGKVPADTQGIVNFADAPYLARKYPCTFCKECKIFSWTRDLPLATVIDRLQSTTPKLTNISAIKTKQDKAGITQEVLFFTKGRKKPYHISRKIMYGLFPEIKSYAFTCTLDDDADEMHVEGVGLGHHMGLCQWGAQAMVEQDWDYKQILQFYYPNTKLMKLCVHKKTPEPAPVQLIEPEKKRAELGNQKNTDLPVQKSEEPKPGPAPMPLPIVAEN